MSVKPNMPLPNETKVYRNTLEFILCWPSIVGRGAYF